MSQHKRDEEALDWEWARNHARKAPKWSDEKWRRMNSLLRIAVSDCTESRRHYPSAS